MPSPVPGPQVLGAAFLTATAENETMRSPESAHAEANVVIARLLDGLRASPA